MDEPRHGNPAPWQHEPQQPHGSGYGPQQPSGYGQQYQQPYVPVLAPPKRPNHLLHLIITVLTCGLWSSVWIVLTARYWNVIDYRNPRERSGMDRRTGIAIAAIVAVTVIGGVAAATSPGTTDTSTTASDVSAPDPATDIADEPEGAQEAEEADPAPAAKAKPKTTVAQQQAIRSAKSYLDLSGFSRAGLLQQLTSSAGSGFKKADAVYAVDHIKVNWNAEAVEAAESYMQLSGFSRAGLIEQLHSKAGSGFTLKQATYAADQVGL